MNFVDLLAALTLLCVGLQVYHYALYPLILWLLSKLTGRRHRTIGAPHALHTSMIICAYNEAGVIQEKLANCRKLIPMPDEIIVVDDGSSDGTAEIAERAIKPDETIRVLRNPTRGGKSAAMNFGAAASGGAVFIFSDANEMYEQEAVHWLLAEFEDPSVAVVSGAHRLRPPERSANGNLVGKSEGLYWRYEDFIRRTESELGATVASVGSMLAIRREDWHPIPAGTVNDDAWLTMSTLARGRNVRFAPNAISWETANDSSRAEHVRRRRISAGRILLLGQREIWPLRRPAVLAAFLSHKVLRLALPILMIGGALGNVGVVSADPDRKVFLVLLAIHLVVAGFAIAGLLAERLGRRWRLAHMAYHIVQSNLMMLAAIGDVIAGKGFLKWDKPAR